MLTEKKKKCFVDEWIEVKGDTCNKKYYESLGYERCKNNKNIKERV